LSGGEKQEWGMGRKTVVWVVERNRGGEWKEKQYFEWWRETGVGNGKKNSGLSGG